MQLLYRINRTGTTVVVVTHDREMVDKMRRRVIALDDGRVVRDQAAGMYADDESTSEFAAPRPRRAGRRRRASPRVLAMSRVFFFIGEGLRALRRSAAPSLAAIVTIAVTVLLLGVLIPVLQATEGKTEEVRDQVGLRSSSTTTPTQAGDRRARDADRRTIPHVAVGRLRLQGRGAEDPRRAARGQGRGRPDEQLPGSATRCRPPSTSSPTTPTTSRRSAPRSRRPSATGEPQPISPIIEEVDDSREEANRSARSPAR